MFTASQSPPHPVSLLPEPLITYLAPFDSKDHKHLKNGKPTVRGSVIRDGGRVAKFTQGVQNGQMQSPDPWEPLCFCVCLTYKGQPQICGTCTEIWRFLSFLLCSHGLYKFKVPRNQSWLARTSGCTDLIAKNFATAEYCLARQSSPAN